MIAVLLVALGGPLLGLWVAVVAACAHDALAPQPAPEPVPYVRRYTLDRYRARQGHERAAT